MSFCVTIQPNGLSFNARDNQTIIEAGQAAGVRFPVSCRNGVCHICRAELVSGKVENQTGEIYESPSADAKEVYICHVRPRSDVTLKVRGVYGPKELPMKEVTCQIQSVEEMQAHVFRVILELPAGKPTEFFAGQYLALCIPEREEDAYFSIACAPGKRQIELHIQADPHFEKAVEVIAFLKSAPSVSVKLPFGKACLASVPEKAVLLLAAGTGFAQMKSLFEYLLTNGFERELSLYWTARKKSDLYACDLLDQLSAQYDNFSYQVIVADSQGPHCTEHHSLLANAVLAGHTDLSNYEVFVSGSPKLVYSSLDALKEAGLEENAFYSDVLEYATRD